ncbi:MAG: hypothetical protein G01um101448_531 [Parcubacteria group bacterium Gr01-1014_48]|nr:MAG: hypothetical protein G01um101448_531 [Parcubacteria group bacterium Gr01-1014_48]
MNTHRKKNKTKEILQGVAALLFFAALMYFSLKIIGSEDMQQRIANSGVFGPLIFMLLKASTIIIAPLGGRPLYVVSPALWGFWPAFIYIFIADTFAYAVIFLISRKFGRRVIRYFVTDRDMHKVDEALDTFGTWKYFVVARFIASEFAGYAAGLTKIPFYQYMAVVVPANFIAIGFALFIGHTFVKSSLSFLITLVALSFVPITFTLLWQKFKKRKASASTIDVATFSEEDV